MYFIWQIAPFLENNINMSNTIWMVFFPGQWQTKNRRRRKHTVILVRHHHSAKEDAGRKQQMELHTSEGPVRTSRPVNCVKKFSYRDITEVNVQNQNPFGPKLQTFVSPETPMTEDAGQHHSAEPLQYSTPWKRALMLLAAPMQMSLRPCSFIALRQSAGSLPVRVHFVLCSCKAATRGGWSCRKTLALLFISQ